MTKKLSGRILPAAFIALASVSLAFSFPARTEEAIDPNVTQYTLENGLTVILAPSKTAQTVALVTRYGVGSADEAPGRSGFAHLFEHLMFEGTNTVPDFDKVVSATGAENNAFTQEDATTYYLSGPKEALPLFLRLDADRMANLANAVNQEDLDNQRAVVLNEMRQNLLDRPGGSAREQSSASLYPQSHPYAHSAIGSIADLSAAKVDDVVAFHRLNYVPSNAYVAITGSFDVAAARALIDKTFALVPKSTSPIMPAVPDVTPKGQRLEFVDAVATPTISFKWPGARGFSKESVTNGMLGVALSVGKDSFDDRLVVQQGLASQAGGYWEDRELGGIFTLTVSAAQGVSAEKLEQEARKAIVDMQKQGFSEETLKIVRTEIETGYDSVPSNPLGLAINLAQSAQNGDARAWKREVELSKTVTPEDVSKAFRAFDINAALVSIVNPGLRNTDYPPVIAKSTGVSRAEPTSARADVVIAEIAMEKAAEVVLPVSETRKLASGATLVSYKIEDPAKAGISIVVKGGDNDAPTGLSNLGMAVTQRGAGDLSLAAMDSRYRESGITIYGSSDSHHSHINASAPVAKFDALTAQLADIVLRPRFDAKEWSALIDQNITRLESYRKLPEYQASKSLRQMLYPAGSPEVRDPQIEEMKIMKSDDAKSLFMTRMRPDATTFHVASNLPADAVASALDKAFAGWTSAGAPETLQEATLPSVKDVKAEIEVKGATQTAIMAALPAPGKNTAESVPFSLAVQVLGGGADSRLNKVLREEKGWSYGISAYADGDKNRNNSLLYVSTTVQADHTSDSFAAIRRIIGEMATKPISEEEFRSAQRTAKADFLSAFDSAPQAAMIVGYLSAKGYDLKDVRKLLTDIDAATLEDVRRQAEMIAKSPIAFSVAGDKATMK